MPRFSFLNDWLTWLENLHSVEIELGLSRVRTVAQCLAIPCEIPAPTQVIMVAGTNGKGSFVATLQKLLTARGRSVGAFTSPHIINYNERIQIDGVNQSDERICDAFSRIDEARGDVSLTYFEFGTLAAMVLFNDRPLDYWILEVGLGGRLDAVNIIDAHMAVITSIDIDHVQWLGETRELIAIEKAGIIKSNSVVVCAEANPPHTLIHRLGEHEPPVYQLDRDFSYSLSNKDLVLSLGSLASDVYCTAPMLSLPSVAAAAQAYVLLESEAKSELDLLSREISSASLGGRFETHVFNGVKIRLDVAHNPAATEYLARRLIDCDDSKYVVLLAVMSDKNILDTIRPLAPLAAHWMCTEVKGVSRCEPCDTLMEKVATVEKEKAENMSTIEAFDVFERAFLRSIQVAKENKLSVLILGSFHTVASARHCLAS